MSEERERVLLDFKAPGRTEEELLRSFREHMVNQERAIRRLVQKIMHANTFGGKLRNPRNPAGTLFFLGPTGVGKTRLVEVFAKLLFGSFEALEKVDCSELQHAHEISRLIGAPPGYIGFDIPPLLTQERLDHWGYVTQQADPGLRRELSRVRRRIDEYLEELEKMRRRTQELAKKTRGEAAEREFNDLVHSARELNAERHKLEDRYRLLQIENGDVYYPAAYPSILLFDEIEKAHPALHDLLLQILDKGELTVNYQRTNEQGRKEASTEKVYFRNTFIFFTSNVAQDEMRKYLQGRGIGFGSPNLTDESAEKEIYRIGLEGLEKKFRGEFLGRIRKENVIVFSSLDRGDILEGLNRLIIPQYLERLTKIVPVEIGITPAVREYLVDESFDKKNRSFGMRAVEGVFTRRVEENLSRLLDKAEDEGGIIPGDKITVDMKRNGTTERELEFSCAPRGPDRSGAPVTLTTISLPEDEDEEVSLIRRVIRTFRFRKP